VTATVGTVTVATVTVHGDSLSSPPMKFTGLDLSSHDTLNPLFNDQIFQVVRSVPVCDSDSRMELRFQRIYIPSPKRHP
jgi:hypothetical protein